MLRHSLLVVILTFRLFARSLAFPVLHQHGASHESTGAVLNNPHASSDPTSDFWDSLGSLPRSSTLSHQQPLHEAFLAPLGHWASTQQHMSPSSDRQVTKSPAREKRKKVMVEEPTSGSIDSRNNSQSYQKPPAKLSKVDQQIDLPDGKKTKHEMELVDVEGYQVPRHKANLLTTLRESGTPFMSMSSYKNVYTTRKKDAPWNDDAFSHSYFQQAKRQNQLNKRKFNKGRKTVLKGVLRDERPAE